MWNKHVLCEVSRINGTVFKKDTTELKLWSFEEQTTHLKEMSCFLIDMYCEFLRFYGLFILTCFFKVKKVTFSQMIFKQESFICLSVCRLCWCCFLWQVFSPWKQKILWQLKILLSVGKWFYFFSFSWEFQPFKNLG